MKYRDLPAKFSRFFRTRRYRSFPQQFPPGRFARIVDVGGTPFIWELLDYPAHITLLNIEPGALKCRNTKTRTYQPVVGDARKMTFQDKSFDLAFSNSVIEHVGTKQDMQEFASEMQRVGKTLYCQTPSKWFPVEPHFGTIFLHWFPRLLKRHWVFRYLTWSGWLHKPTPSIVQKFTSETLLLSKRDMQQLFPNATIRTERVLWLPKSYTAIQN